MRGTEKQIAFAAKLIEKFDSEMDKIIAICPDEAKQEWISGKEKIRNIFDEAYAGDVIDALKGNNKEGISFYRSFYALAMVGGDDLSVRIKKEVWGK